MNQDSNGADSAPEAIAEQAEEEQIGPEEAELEAEVVASAPASASQVGASQAEAEPEDMEAWGEEFSPEELAELFGGEENVPSQVLAPEPPELIGEAGGAAEDGEEEGAGERLQKLLARTGVASRRSAEELIRAGRVSVNNEIVTELGRRAHAGRDRIAVDGKPLRVPGVGSTVVMLNKPRGCVSTKVDPQGRTTVMAYLPKKLAHLHPVGRLDFDTSGLLLLTDDGELTNLLLHPSHGVEKRYHARVRGVVSVGTIDWLQKGVRLDDGETQPCRVRVKAQTPSNALLEIVLREGRNRQIRRMLQVVGHSVSALRRVRVGPLDMGGLLPGAYRELLPGEVHLLKKAARATKAPLKGARPFAYKPRPSKAEDKSVSQASDRPSSRPSQRSPQTRHNEPPHRSASARPAQSSPEYSEPRARPSSPRPAGKSAPREENPRGGARSGAWGGAPRDGARGQRPQSDRPGSDRPAPRPSGERSWSERPAPRASGEHPNNGRPNSARPNNERPNRPNPYPRPEARDERGARADGNRASNFAGSDRAPRDNRPPSPRPSNPRGEHPAARDNAAPRASSGPARPSAPRPSGAPGTQGAPQKRGGSKLAKRIEDRWK